MSEFQSYMLFALLGYMAGHLTSIAWSIRRVAQALEESNKLKK